MKQNLWPCQLHVDVDVALQVDGLGRQVPAHILDEAEEILWPCQLHVGDIRWLFILPLQVAVTYF